VAGAYNPDKQEMFQRTLQSSDAADVFSLPQEAKNAADLDELRQRAERGDANSTLTIRPNGSPIVDSVVRTWDSRTSTTRVLQRDRARGWLGKRRFKESSGQEIEKEPSHKRKIGRGRIGRSGVAKSEGRLCHQTCIELSSMHQIDVVKGIQTVNYRVAKVFRGGICGFQTQQRRLCDHTGSQKSVREDLK
jgi:hypothetical protein